ncbi:unnamed protein product [Gongylonema pulchrum]|uniref:protein-tyrosine-phosphatase n=1 Tax=Gongylonema pulchrum TaxID=637853 RepID=A0A183DN17_9BILA|nr:unnamed protein product [Gongylonema pulchrum]
MESESSFGTHLQDTDQSEEGSPVSGSKNTGARVHKRRTADPVESTTVKKAKEDTPTEERPETPVQTDFENIAGARALSGSGGALRVSVQKSLSSSFLEARESSEPNDLALCPPVNYELPVVLHPSVSSCAYAAITASTLIDLWRSLGEENFSRKFLLIDCRYPYEYNGGHIRGAINLFDPAHIEEVLFPADTEQRQRLVSRKPIFYCEFSHARAPHINRAIVIICFTTAACFLLQGQRATRVRSHSELPQLPANGLSRNVPARSLFEPFGYVRMYDRKFSAELAKYNFHHSKTIDCVYHTLARSRQVSQLAVSPVSQSSEASDDDPFSTPIRALSRVSCTVFYKALAKLHAHIYIF